MKFKKILFLAAMTCSFLVGDLPVAFGQEKGQEQEQSFGVFENRQQYAEFMGGLKQLNDPEVNSMIPAINDMVLGQPIGQTANQYGIGQRDGLMSLLTRPEIRKEIDMIDSQFQKLQSVNGEIQAGLAKQFREIDLSEAGGVLESIQRINSEARSRLETVLSPAQKKRLRQLALQNVLRRVGLTELLTTNPLAKELDLSQEERKKLKVDAKKIEEELEQKIAKLREEAKKKIIGKLSKKQQNQLKDLLGETFLFKDKKKDKPKKKASKKKWSGKK